MPPRSLAVILNPAAGNRRAGRTRAQLREALEASGAPFEVLTTQRPNHAAALAHDAAARFDAVIAAGGDGTLQEVASGLLSTDADAVLGIIPLGTGNDFARLLGVPKKPADAVRALLDAEVVPIDAGIVRWREATDDFLHEAAFVNAVGIGFDALVAAEAARFKWFRGRSGYLAAVLKALRLWPQPHVEVRCTDDGEPGELVYDGPFFLAAVSNGTAVGGGFRLTPDAEPGDGLLDLCLAAGPLSTLRVFQLLPMAIFGRHTNEPEVTMRRVRSVTLAIAGGAPIHADGEGLTRTATDVAVEVRPGALRMLRPR